MGWLTASSPRVVSTARSLGINNNLTCPITIRTAELTRHWPSPLRALPTRPPSRGTQRHMQAHVRTKCMCIHLATPAPHGRPPGSWHATTLPSPKHAARRSTPPPTQTRRARNSISQHVRCSYGRLTARLRQTVLPCLAPAAATRGHTVPNSAALRVELRAKPSSQHRRAYADTRIRPAISPTNYQTRPPARFPLVHKVTYTI